MTATTAATGDARRRYALITAGLLLPWLAAFYQLAAIHLARIAAPATSWTAWGARLFETPWTAVLVLTEVVSFVLWIMVLGVLPLAIAFPLTALGSVLGLLMAGGMLGAAIPPLSWIGTVAILAGAWLIVGDRA